MLAGGGQLDGVRILSSKTLAYMTQNHLPNGQDMKSMYKQAVYSEVQGAGAGFGLGFSVVFDPVSRMPQTALVSCIQSLESQWRLGVDGDVPRSRMEQ